MTVDADAVCGFLSGCASRGGLCRARGVMRLAGVLAVPASGDAMRRHGVVSVEMVGFMGEVSPSGVGTECRSRSVSTLCARAEIAPDGECGDGLCGCCCGKYRRFASAGRRRHYLGFALVVTAGSACLCRSRHGRDEREKIPPAPSLCRAGRGNERLPASLPNPPAILSFYEESC